MMLLICFAFITSVFLLPACLAADKVVRAKIRGEASFMDFGDDIVLTDENMDAIDAVLDS
jgi:hypothetical protein